VRKRLFTQALNDMISTRDHRSDTLSTVHSPTPPKHFAVPADILLLEFLYGQCRPWQPYNSPDEDERLDILNQIFNHVDDTVIKVDGLYQPSFKSSGIPTSRIVDITLPPSALEALRARIHICGPTRISHLRNITAAGDQRGGSSSCGNQSVIPLQQARNNDRGSSKNRKGKQNQKDGPGEDRADSSEQTNSGDSVSISKPNTVQCPICTYDPSPGPGENNIYSSTWFNVG
jgi:hypothetical protein